MSRSTDTRKLAQRLSNNTQTEVTAHFNEFSHGKGWVFVWTDGPTVTTMRRRARRAVADLSGVELDELTYRRGHTDLAIVAAWLHRVQQQPTRLRELAHTSFDAFDETDLPGKIGQLTWDMARFAMRQAGVDQEDAAGAFSTAVHHITKVGLTSLRLDMWLTGAGIGDESGTAMLDATVSERLRAELDQIIGKFRTELVGGSQHHDDPRVRLLATELCRRFLLNTLHEHQADAITEALLGGTSLNSLSTMLGLAPRTLGMRHPKTDLDVRLAPRAWLRDHGEAWATACNSAAAAVRAAAPDLEFIPWRQRDDYSTDLGVLERCQAARGWRSLASTPDRAQRVLDATRQFAPDYAVTELARLATLLTNYRNAAPPSLREKRTRRPAVPTRRNRDGDATS